MIDSVLQKISQNGEKEPLTHLVYAGFYYNHFDDQLISFIVEGMKKHKMKSLMLSIIFMRYHGSISKETMENDCKGKYRPRKESINDDLESFLNHLRLGQDVRVSALTYFFPQAEEKRVVKKSFVKKEIDPIYEQILANLERLNPDLRRSRMKPPETKFLDGWCRRRTILIKH